MGERTPNVRDGDLAETLGYLAEVIASRRDADPSESYTAKLLQGGEDERLKKVVEEATEVALASKDHDHDHIRYEAADLLYHLLVVLDAEGVSLAELAGELDSRH